MAWRLDSVARGEMVVGDAGVAASTAAAGNKPRSYERPTAPLCRTMRWLAHRLAPEWPGSQISSGRTVMHRARRLGALLLLAWCVGLVVPPAPTAAQGSIPREGVVAMLSRAADAIQARLDAGDAVGARIADEVLETLWSNVEDIVRGVSSSMSHDIEQAMHELRDAIPTSASNPGPARTALAMLRGQIALYANRVGVPVPSAPVGDAAAGAAGSTTPAPPFATSPSPSDATTSTTASAAAASTTASTSTASVADCARYAGQAAQPFFDSAQALVGNAPLPGIPPAQTVTPQYAYGPGPVPGSTAAGPYRQTLPYLGRVGPGAYLGGGGVPAPNSQLTVPGLVNVFQLGGQLPPIPNSNLSALAPSDIISLGANQSSEAGNAIALGGLQQSVVTNQINYSTLRYDWVQTYIQLSAEARNLALLHCGRIP
jgi:hypothetical protein